MKASNFLAVLLVGSMFLSVASCNKDKAPEVIPDPTEGLVKVLTLADPNHPYKVTLYTENGNLQLGYNKVYFTVTDADGKFIPNATLSAFPEMDMGMMKHSTPRSEITKVPDKALYEAYYSFLMAGAWLYDVDYTVGNISGSIVDAPLDVKNVFRPDGTTERKVIQSVTATDGSEKRYVISLIEPTKPKEGANEIKAYIHERVDGNTYTPVENFTLKLDPRMPAMGNHSSPNNVDLTWDAANKTYKGTVNFSMTGYWTLNLLLVNGQGVTLYGNAVTEEVEKSSLYFEVEF
jgi:hypothetical protein